MWKTKRDKCRGSGEATGIGFWGGCCFLQVLEELGGGLLCGVMFAVFTEPSVGEHLSGANPCTELWLSSQACHAGSTQRDKKIRQASESCSALQMFPGNDEAETKGQRGSIQKGVEQNYPI